MAKKDVEKNKKVRASEDKKTEAASKKKKNDDKTLIKETVGEDNTLFGANRKDFKELISPEGIDTTPRQYVIINDGVKEYYACSLFVNSLPEKTRFVQSYRELFNFPFVTSTVFFEKVEKGEARSLSDRRVRALGSERADCTDIKTGRVKDENKYRRLDDQYVKAQEWARRIESGDNSIYTVQFLFTITAKSTEELNRAVEAFELCAKGNGFEVVCTFCLHDKAFVSSYPLNKAQLINGKHQFLKVHYLDKFAMADIFNHCDSHFFHEDGVYLGHFTDNYQMFTWDPYDKSHSGMGALFAGSTGVGKSATVKMAQKRMIDFGMRVRTLDVDSPGTEGEYAKISRACGYGAHKGVHFSIKTNSDNVLNPYHINEETQYEENIGKEVVTLALNAKLEYLTNLIISMVEIGKGTIDKVTESAIKSIVVEVNSELYEERGIYEGKADSLYEDDDERGGLVSSGRKKKTMPTLSDAFKKILIKRAHNTNQYYSPAFQILVDTMQFYVKEVYYSDISATFFTKEEYDAMDVDSLGRKVVNTKAGEEVVHAVHGIRSYFDGQSSLMSDYDTPYVDYDISQLPREDKAFAMIVCLGYIEENDIRTNSDNPLNAKKMIVLMDELHLVFPYEKARKIVESFYRQARKRFISPWCATQSIADFDLYPDMQAIFKNSDSFFLFRHNARDAEFIKKYLPLTDSQVTKVLSLGIDSRMEATEEERNARRGEVCLVDANRVAFIKVDYLVDTEAKYVETNVAKLKKMAEERAAATAAQ